MDVLSLAAVLVVTMFGHTSEIPAGYYGNCISLRDSIKESRLVAGAECRVEKARAP